MIPNCEKITKFRDIYDWIMWDWDYHYSLNRDENGNFYVNKLYITPTHLSYKCECAEIEEGLFEQVEELYNFLRKNDV